MKKLRMLFVSLMVVNHGFCKFIYEHSEYLLGIIQRDNLVFLKEAVISVVLSGIF